MRSRRAHALPAAVARLGQTPYRRELRFDRDVEAIAAWHARSGDEAWSLRRGRIVGLLAEADRLAALADLVGVAALPAHERVVLLAGRLARETVLQQNSLSANDAYCTAEKAAALVEALISTVDALLGAVAAGVPAADLEQVDYSPLLRAREEAPPDGAGVVLARRDALLTRIRDVSG